jgi:2-methylcitrate dehydratase PrpD
MAAAAREGFGAAQLAACGLTGPLGVIEGPSGWLAATAPAGDAAALDEPRAEPWLWDLSFKPWPACRHAHPAMDALRELLAREPVLAEQVRGVEVHGYADALRFCDRVHPATEAQARFSIPHALAAWLCWGEPALAHYRDAALADPRVAALRERVHLMEDPAIEARYPAHYGARVVLHRHDGLRLEHALIDTVGDPVRPMSEAAIEAKARVLMHAAGWPAGRIDAAVAACAALPEAPTLAALDAVLLGPGDVARAR